MVSTDWNVAMHIGRYVINHWPRYLSLVFAWFRIAPSLSSNPHSEHITRLDNTYIYRTELIEKEKIAVPFNWFLQCHCSAVNNVRYTKCIRLSPDNWFQWFAQFFLFNNQIIEKSQWHFFQRKFDRNSVGDM